MRAMVRVRARLRLRFGVRASARALVRVRLRARVEVGVRVVARLSVRLVIFGRWRYTKCSIFKMLHEMPHAPARMTPRSIAHSAFVLRRSRTSRPRAWKRRS